MGFEHAFLNQMPWYHKLWFIPVVLIGLIVIGAWDGVRSRFRRQ